MPKITVINSVGKTNTKAVYQEACTMADPPNCPCEWADWAPPGSPVRPSSEVGFYITKEGTPPAASHTTTRHHNASTSSALGLVIVSIASL